jgi:hypothetical protein
LIRAENAMTDAGKPCAVKLRIPYGRHQEQGNGVDDVDRQEGIHMPTTSPYSGLPNKLVRAANGVDYAYRDAGPEGVCRRRRGLP